MTYDTLYERSKNNAEIKTVYYNDPLNDEFSGVIKKRKVSVGADFKYINTNLLYSCIKFIIYRILATPIAFLYSKFKFNLKIIGKEKIKKYKNQGYFLYGNHTQMLGDGFMPNVATFPKSTYFITNPDNIATRGTKNIMMMMGVLPTPTDIHGFSNFSKAIKTVIEKKSCVVIYPEAHIWPYHTGIRPFRNVSFKYPIKNKAPSFSSTVTYSKSKRGKPQIVIYIDGPFFGDGKNVKEKQTNLRDKVYNAMCARAENHENYAFIEYKPFLEKSSE